ncbi:MAG: hypothetical protein EZS28_055572, partial [Streblomastix strix]
RGVTSGAIHSTFKSLSGSDNIQFIIDKCNFISCGGKQTIVGSLLFDGQGSGTNFGQISVTNSKFYECLGQKAGGILFGDGIQPQSAQNNIFSNNNLTTTEGESSADIIFQSKQLLDNAGGIESVAQGYKFEQIEINSTATGEVKIQGFSSNFGPYLDCVTRNGKENCEQIPCGGKLNQKPEDCEQKLIDEEQKDIQD